MTDPEWVAPFLRAVVAYAAYRRPFAGAAAGARTAVRSKDAPDRGAGEGDAIPPGDGPEPHEDNTFGLPDGKPIRRELRRWFDLQYKAVLGTVPTIGVPVPGMFRPLTEWDDRMSEAMVPLLSAYWDESGKRTLAKFGLDPDEWRVTNPHLKARIEEAAFDFCHSTNATTTERLDKALADLHELFVRGQVEENTTMAELTEGVNAIFTGLSEHHAATIAVTEASRAVHAAQEAAATEFGDVAGFELLLSADACELCRKVYRECKRAKVGQPFAVIGDSEAYKHIKYPPLHVRCQCSMTHVFKPEDGGPEDPGWGTTYRPDAGPEGEGDGE